MLGVLHARSKQFQTGLGIHVDAGSRRIGDSDILECCGGLPGDENPGRSSRDGHSLDQDVSSRAQRESVGGGFSQKRHEFDTTSSNGERDRDENGPVILPWSKEDDISGGGAFNGHVQSGPWHFGTSISPGLIRA